MLQEAKVSCAGCHMELIRTPGGAQYRAYFEKDELITGLFLAAGKIPVEKCLVCHDQAGALKEGGNKILLHQKHVTEKNGRCLDCHGPVVHAKSDQKAPNPELYPSNMLDAAVQLGCGACHPEPHRLQRLLMSGPKRADVPGSPDPMFRARTNCMGCHMELKTSGKGHKVVRGSAKACVACHTPNHEKMLNTWKSELAKEIQYAKEVEQEAWSKINARYGGKPPSGIKTRLQEGRENLEIVMLGNGVHNKKYSMLLLDAAINIFQNLIDSLESQQQKK